MVEQGLMPGQHYEDGEVCPVCGGTVWVLGILPRSEPRVYMLGCKQAWNPILSCGVLRDVPECVVVVEDVTNAARG